MAKPIKYSKVADFFFYQAIKERALTALDIIFCRPIEITLFFDEIEALKLHNIDDFSQIEVAERMNISQPTVARILKRAYKKITTALLEGKTIRIKNMRTFEKESASDEH